MGILAKDPEMKARVRTERDSRRIICPHCDKVNYDPIRRSTKFNTEKIITLFGGGEPQPATCAYCEKEFHVLEEVDRTFEVTP